MKQQLPNDKEINKYCIFFFHVEEKIEFGESFIGIIKLTFQNWYVLHTF